ncbi:MAG: excinuclease ABC subunit UvrA [Deltaproteobacteria bacterium]|nr:excinuclease ABC subunit UvrA [Deltaproteobacteria bacterium]
MANLKTIRLSGVRQNNLKNFALEIPLEKFVCITGPSGSGKSSLAFDTLYAEGYRRYVESLSTYARQFFEKVPKPDIDSIENICPSIALQQKNPVRNSRSTVGTSTEIYDYLRLCFSKLGQSYCPKCGELVKADTAQSAADAILGFLREKSDRAYLGFFLKEEAKVDQLIEKGFLRRLSSASSPEPIELESERGKNLKAKSLIVYDRLVVSMKDRHRLVESLEGSFRESSGEAFIFLSEAKKILKFSSEFRCANCDIAVPKPSPLLFSFNSPLGACPACKGFGNTLEYDEKLLVPNTRLSLDRGAVDPFTKPIMKKAQKKLIEFADKMKIAVDAPWTELTEKERKLLMHGQGAYKGIVGHFKKLEEKKYKLHVRVFIRRFQTAFRCEVCKGSRLRPEALFIKVKGKTIFDLTVMSLENLEKWFAGISWTPAEKTINREVLRQLQSRLHFLNRMGLQYLNLARLSKTLSGGETQRILLSNQLGSELSGTLYVLDEPSIGLHPTDRDRLLDSLKDLIQMGNSIVVVEHDLDTISKSDTVIELGPGSGKNGGEIIFNGDYKDFRKSGTLTAKYLRNESRIELPKNIREGSAIWLSIQGATENNLRDVSLRLPLHRLIGVSGVSGSGKSTLIHQTLYNALARLFYQSTETIGHFKKLFGSDKLRGVVMLDQSPIGKSARSIPLTIIGAYDDIRSLFSSQLKAKRAGLAARDFSFNLPGGRCETCQGEGVVKTEMYFLDDLYLTCETCEGRRFKKEILQIKVRGKSIYDIFQMTVSEARTFFADHRSLGDRMELLEKVGLGYLQLGQSSHTLSGGESQRLKIASELMDRKKKNLLYILDEPTTGLHISEVGLLIKVLQDLVENGNTVVVIEHNIDVLKSVDWLVDMGPGAGENGGQIVAEGTPQQISKSKTKTAIYLKKAFEVAA